MKQVFEEITERINALQLRERAMLLFAVCLVLFLFADTFGLQPSLNQQKSRTSDIMSLSHKLNVLRERSGLLSGKTDEDPSSRRDQLQSELTTMEQILHRELGAMLDPDQAMQVLEQVLSEEQELKLIKADAISRPLGNAEQAQDGTNEASDIGRYGLHLQLEGNYLATLHYLTALEALPWKFFWEGVSFEVIEYPKARVSLDIYTLGLHNG